MRIAGPKDIKKRSNGFGSVGTDIYFSVNTEFEDIAIKRGFEFLERVKIGARSRSLFLWKYSTSKTGDDETILRELSLLLKDTIDFGLKIDWKKSTY